MTNDPPGSRPQQPAARATPSAREIEQMLHEFLLFLDGVRRDITAITTILFNAYNTSNSLMGGLGSYDRADLHVRLEELLRRVQRYNGLK